MSEKDEKRLKHPSFGILSISRGVCSKNMNMFGSSILQRTFVQLNIHRAILIRGVNRDWVVQDGVPLISIYLSPSQFADAITSLNTEGTPCTIRFAEGKEVPQARFENKRVQFDREFEDKMKEVASSTNEFYNKIAEVLSKPNIGKRDREEILKQLNQLKMQIESNIPYMKKTFTEQMDETVVEAKNELSSFLEAKIRQLGLEGYKKELQKALEYIDKGEQKKDE